MNACIVTGRLTRDPELRYIQGSGTAVCSFSVAVDRGYKDSNGNKITDFFPIEIFGKRAESCANYLSKGDLVGIHGSIRNDSFQDKNTGQNRTITKINANEVEFLQTKGKQQGQGQSQGQGQWQGQGQGYNSQGNYGQGNYNQGNYNQGNFQGQGYSSQGYQNTQGQTNEFIPQNDINFPAIDDDDIPF